MRFLALIFLLLLVSCSLLDKEGRNDSSVVEKKNSKGEKAEVVKTADLDNRNQEKTPEIDAKGDVYIRGEEQKLSYLISQTAGSRIYVSSLIISEIDGVSYRKLTLAKSGLKIKARLHKKHKSGKTEVKLTLTLDRKSVSSVFEVVKSKSMVDFELGQNFLEYNYTISK